MSVNSQSDLYRAIPHRSGFLRANLRQVNRVSLPRVRSLLVAVGFACLLPALPIFAQQNESGGADAGTCTLKNHVYTCDGATFQTLLTNAKTVAVQAHNADGYARSQLSSLLTKKLGKTIAPDGTQADLIFLMIPTENAGSVDSSLGNVTLGTLRVYSSGPDGSRQHLLWAEDYSGTQDMPWPAVVNGLINQFRSHFHIK